MLTRPHGLHAGCLCAESFVQVIRAGNMTVRLTGSATNLPVPAVGPPLVVMTPTCENRSTREYLLFPFCWAFRGACATASRATVDA